MNDLDELMEDVEAFDPALATFCQRVRATEGRAPSNQADVASLQLQFDSGEAVTNSNRMQYLEQPLQEELFSSRQAAIEALKRGFHTLPSLTSVFTNLRPSELMVRLSLFSLACFLPSFYPFIGLSNSLQGTDGWGSIP